MGETRAHCPLGRAGAARRAGGAARAGPRALRDRFGLRPCFVRRLRAFNMRNNRLGVLPHELSSVPSLKNLYYSGNQARAPPARPARP